MRRGVVWAGGLTAIIGGAVGLVGVIRLAMDLLASGIPEEALTDFLAQFMTFGGLAVGLIGIGFALLAPPDRRILRRRVVWAGGLTAIIGGAAGLVGVIRLAMDLLASGFPGVGFLSLYINFIGLSVGLVGIGVALLGLPDR